MQLKEVSRRTLLEKENLVLIFILFAIVCMIIHGETLIQIPRYYTIEITDNNGITKWIFVKEENRFDSFAKGEDNKFWEPPCVAEDQSDVVTAPIEIMEAYDEDVPGSYDYPPPLKDIFNDSTNYEENDTELFNIKDILIPRDTTKREPNVLNDQGTVSKDDDA
ncbi:uncharacterized protein LOC120341142 [Styela clava]|uniref:uncharacterized protein LOC120341142 n=1 Tax=Styela clava TaxID=7725 RepID=UPI001939F442|nr:uncharacterized protein LOC120341142 [Styela clava]